MAQAELRSLRREVSSLLQGDALRNLVQEARQPHAGQQASTLIGRLLSGEGQRRIEVDALRSLVQEARQPHGG